MPLPRYVSTKSMAQKALTSVEEGALDIHPSKYIAEWRRWLISSQDWCISRQLWWGHRIPAYRMIVPPGEVDDTLNELGKWAWAVGNFREEGSEAT